MNFLTLPLYWVFIGIATAVSAQTSVINFNKHFVDAGADQLAFAHPTTGSYFLTYDANTTLGGFKQAYTSGAAAAYLGDSGFASSGFERNPNYAPGSICIHDTNAGVYGVAWQADTAGSFNSFRYLAHSHSSSAPLTRLDIAVFDADREFRYSILSQLNGNGASSVQGYWELAAGDILLMQADDINNGANGRPVDINMALTFTAAPEPSSGILVAFFTLFLFGRRRR